MNLKFIVLKTRSESIFTDDLEWCLPSPSSLRTGLNLLCWYTRRAGTQSSKPKQT